MFGPESVADPYRGLYLGPGDIERLLAQVPGQPLFGGLGPALPPEGLQLPLPFRRLAEATRLSDFDVSVILLALAPELDLRYERLYAYLQDDVTKKWPTVDLALNILCADTAEKLAMRARFRPDAPLLRHGLLALVAETGQTSPPLPAMGLRLDPQVTAALLGETRLDSRLFGLCEIVEATAPGQDAPRDAPRVARLLALEAAARRTGGALLLHFHGPDRLARRRAAESFAAALRRPLLWAGLDRLRTSGRDFGELLQTTFREAWLRGAVPYLDNLDAPPSDQDGEAALRALLALLSEAPGVTILAGELPSALAETTGLGVVPVAFAAPDAAERLGAWQEELRHHGLADGSAATLAARFALTTGQIRDAVEAAVEEMRWRGAGEPGVLDPPDLLATARLQTRHLLANLAQLIEPTRGWNDLVLPGDSLAQLKEIGARFVHRERVLQGWGFARKLAYGIGTNVLFAGPSGTGKTMAAEIIAQELGLDLFRIDLAGVVSKYIGETEKNLDRIFLAAKHANAILFFDEADALFGKRSEVKDAHDRYANLEISYLLQKMELYEGIAILATNLRQNLDEAFVRRLAYIVQFPFPDDAHRRRIWAGVWPKGVPLAPDIDLDELAAELKLSGGGIRNVALAAAFLAATEGGSVTQEHLRRAAQRELRKLGRTSAGADGAAR